MVKCQLWVCVLLVVVGTISTISCNQTEYENCTSDYNILEGALFNGSQNMFMLKMTFFPPHTTNPLYLTVTYKFSTGTSVDYIWSSADLYLTIHPHIISYLSLFFSFIETDRVVHMELQLPEECSDLTNNTRSDPTNFLFVLTHRLWHYAQDSTTDMKDLEAVVVASESRKHHHGKESVALFFSLALLLPIAALGFVWVSVHGAIPYIRSHINNSDNFPSIAAVYCIGQTLTFFVIVMDIIALSKHSAVVEHDKLDSYQFGIISFVVSVEIFGLVLSIVLALIPFFSHYKNTTCKCVFEAYFDIYKHVICCGLLFKKIGRKEARVWLFLGSLITPLIAISSHAGFIVGGWVSYEDRSTAIFLLYLFIFGFLYWSLHYMYSFSNAFINFTLRKKKVSLLWHSRGPEIENVTESAVVDANIESMPDHHEYQMYTTTLFTKHIGFDTIALFLMQFIILFVYGMFFYFALGLVVLLLPSIDEALLHIFKLGEYAFVIIVFLLTYKVFTISNGGVAHRLISNDALKYWRFLNSNWRLKNPIVALKRATELLNLTLETFEMEDKKVYTTLLKKRKFDLQVVASHLAKAAKEERDPGPDVPITNHRQAARIFKSISGCDDVDLETFGDQLVRVTDWIYTIRTLNRKEQETVNEFCAGINHFRRTLVKVLGVPPMYMNSDKANALTAALVYQKVNGLYMKRGEVPVQVREEPVQREEQPVQVREEPVQREKQPVQVREEPVQREEQPVQVREGPNEARRQICFEDNKRYALLLSVIDEDF